MPKMAEYLNNIRDQQTRAAVQGVFELLKADLDANKAAFDAHTHNGDGAQVGAYYTSPPRSNTATVTAGAASTFAQNLTP